jgi:hypothetical protein
LLRLKIVQTLKSSNIKWLFLKMSTKIRKGKHRKSKKKREPKKPGENLKNTKETENSGTLPLMGCGPRE